MLIKKVKRYINHKVILSGRSNYYSARPQSISIQIAFGMMRSFCKDAAYLTKQDVARMILRNKQHLFNILPAELNSSYASSLTNYTELIQESEQILAPKQHP